MNPLASVLLFFATLFAGWRAWRRLQYFLHILQLEAYHLNEYARWVFRRLTPLVAGPSHLAGLLVLAGAAALVAWRPATWPLAVAAFLWCIAFASSYRYQHERTKKPLRYTYRIRRLIAAATLFPLAGLAAGGFFLAAIGLPEGGLAWLAAFLVADLGAPLWVGLAGLLMWPVEHTIQRRFKEQARRKLADSPELTVIGITGSFGKTSVKFVAAEILRQRFNVLATPGSYNTPMGICLVVNNRLAPDHRVLVLEMGARYTGDIRELCELAPPDVAVVTAVGPAHLDTMGPIENIARVKREIVDHMKPGGPVVLNADDPRVLAMRGAATGPVWRVSIDGNEAEISAHEITFGPEGTRFVVRDESGDEQVFTSVLLGRHNVLNILFGVALGRIMGLRLRQIAHAVRRIIPVEHRLQLRQQHGLTVIDDAFNSNPVGARAAVDVLEQFRSGRRYVITPGMVELGSEQDDENRRFGAYMASRVDTVLLVGRRQTAPIRLGLLEAGFPEDHVHVFDTLFDAQEYLQKAARAGDTVLYENDLPDQYTERS